MRKLLSIFLFLAPLFAFADDVKHYERLNETGDSLLSIGEYEQALATYRQAQTEAEQAKDLVAVATTLTNQGVAYRITQRNDSALACYQRALDVARQSGDKSETSHVLCSIAILYANTQRFNEAERYARMSATEAHASGDMDMIMYCDYTCGSILTLQGKYSEAIGVLRGMVGEAGRAKATGVYAERIHGNDRFLP